MSDNNQAGTACDLRGIREAVCVHTDKISDSCLAKDCIEDLQVYLTVPSQQALDCAVSAKARYVELLHVGVHVETVPYSTGYYTVDLTFYYRVIADASAAGGRPTTVTGLAIFSKRLVMFGGETSARSFSSRSGVSCLCKQAIQAGNVPEAIVEVVDPMILGSRVQEVCSCNCCPPSPPVIPEAILGCFEEQLRPRRREQASARHDRAVFHRAARAQHAAAHPDVRLLHPVEDVQKRRQLQHRIALRGLRPDRVPDGRFLPQQE